MLINYTGDKNKTGYTSIHNGTLPNDYNSKPKIQVSDVTIDGNKAILTITQPVYIFPKKELFSRLSNSDYTPQYLGLWSKLKNVNPVFNQNSNDSIKNNYIHTQSVNIEMSASGSDYICFDNVAYRNGEITSLSDGKFSIKNNYNDTVYYYEQITNEFYRNAAGYNLDFSHLFVSPLLTANHYTSLNNVNTYGWYLAGCFNYNNLNNLTYFNKDEKNVGYSCIQFKTTDNDFESVNNYITGETTSVPGLNIVNLSNQSKNGVFNGFLFSNNDITYNFTSEKYYPKYNQTSYSIRDKYHSYYGLNRQDSIEEIYKTQQFINYNQQQYFKDDTGSDIGCGSRDTTSDNYQDRYCLTRSITEKPLKLFTGYNDSEFTEIHFRHRCLSPITRLSLNPSNNSQTSRYLSEYRWYNSIKQSDSGKYNNFDETLASYFISNDCKIKYSNKDWVSTNQNYVNYKKIVGENKTNNSFEQIVNITDVQSLSNASLTFDNNGKIITTNNLISIDDNKTNTVQLNNRYYYLSFPQNDGFLPLYGKYNKPNISTNSITGLTSTTGYYYMPIGLFNSKYCLINTTDNNVLSPNPYTNISQDSNVIKYSTLSKSSVALQAFRIPQYSYVNKKYNSPYCWYTSTVNLDNPTSIENGLNRFSINGSSQFKNLTSDDAIYQPFSGNVFDDLFHQTNINENTFVYNLSNSGDFMNWLTNVYTYIDSKGTVPFKRFNIKTKNEYDVNNHKINEDTSNNKILKPKKINYVSNSLDISGSNIQVYSIPTDIMDVYSVYNNSILNTAIDNNIWWQYIGSSFIVKDLLDNTDYWDNHRDKYKECVIKLLNMNQSFDKEHLPCDSLNELKEHIDKLFYDGSLSDFKTAIRNIVKTNYESKLSNTNSNSEYKYLYGTNIYTDNETIVNKLISYYQNDTQTDYPAKYCFSYVDNDKINSNIQNNKEPLDDAIKSLELFKNDENKKTTPIFWKYSFICVPVEYKVEVEFDNLNNDFIKYIRDDETTEKIPLTVNCELYTSSPSGATEITGVNWETSIAGDLFDLLNDSTKNHVFIVDNNNQDQNINTNSVLKDKSYLDEHLIIKFLSDDKIESETVSIDDYTEELDKNCYTISISESGNNPITISYKSSKVIEWIKTNTNVNYLNNKAEGKIKHPVAMILLKDVNIKIDNKTFASGNTKTSTKI